MQDDFFSIQRVCAIHDLSGFGRASLTAVIPVLSTMGIQVCPLPTAVLSSQTSGMTDFSFCDLTDELPRIIAHWEKIELRFSSVYSGFLGNPRQIEAAKRCICDFLHPAGFAFVDPVLGDNGHLDPTQTPEMIEAQRHLIAFADIIAPNLTEASFLLDVPYEANLSLPRIKEELRALSDLGPTFVIITSATAEIEGNCAVVAYNKKKNEYWRIENRHIPVYYPGTGDTFSSVLVGAFLQGNSLPLALSRAVNFVSKSIEFSFMHSIPQEQGVFLEGTLHTLRQEENTLSIQRI